MSVTATTRSPLLGGFAAVTAALLWGFAFITLKWAYAGIGPIWLTAIRFIVAFAIALPLIRFHREMRRALSWKDATLALLPGTLLGIDLLLQAKGLSETSVANSGFLTVLYAVFVPIGEVLILRRRVRQTLWIWIALALLGSVLLTGLRWDSGSSPHAAFNRGDLLTVACAVFGALHILAVCAIEPKITSAFATNAWQLLWAGLVTLPFALYTERAPSWSVLTWPVLGSMTYLVIVSTILGFFLQLKAQQHLPPSSAGLLCVLESPFAAAFAFFLLGESLTPSRMVGAALMLVAAIGAIWRGN
jgi:drug/metabolite transporter (DMT)-like permease